MARLLKFLLLCAAYISIDVGSSAAGLPQSPAFAVTNAGASSSRHRHPRAAGAAQSVASTRMSDSPSPDDRDSLDSHDNARRLLLPMSALLSLSLVSLAALTQHLPGPPIDAAGIPSFWGTVPFGVLYSGSCDAYSPSLVLRDASSAAICITGATVFVEAVTHSAKIGILEPRDSRKIIHTLSAPLFMILWPLFSDAYGARAFADMVQLLNALRL